MATPPSVAPETAGHRRLTVLRLAAAGLGLASGLLLEFGMESAVAVGDMGLSLAVILNALQDR